jgi:thiol:disulfide interchange protein DsbC
MKKSVLIFTLLAGFLTGSSSFAADAAADAAADPAIEKVRSSLAMLLPRLRPDAIRPAGFLGLYEVAIGTRLIYVSEDGRYLLQGQVIDLETRTPLTEERLQDLKRVAIDGLDESDMIIYGDEKAPHTVTVFTDIDCGYCRKLHAEMDQYNEQGIRIRYLAYPRGGMKSHAARQSVSVWCADDRSAAMTAAKTGGTVEARDCENPVADHYELGQEFGIRGTPALVLEDGEVLPGYLPAKRLITVLEQRRSQAAE